MRIRENILADYIEGYLGCKDRLRVKQHLERCPLCREEVSLASGFIRGGVDVDVTAVPEHVTRRAIVVVGRKRKMVFKWKEMIPDWLVVRAESLAPVRGTKSVLGENLILVKKTFQDFQVELVFENLGRGRACIRGKWSGGDGSEEPLRATLHQNGREVSSHLLATPEICFEDIPFGSYTLIFARAGEKVGEYPFELKEHRHGRK